MSTAYITHRECQRHDMGDHHPEAPLRLRAIDDALLAQQLYDFLRHFDAPLVTEEQLLRVHPKSYLDHLETLVPEEAQGIVSIDEDTIMNSHSLAAAKHAAGAGVLAVDKVMAGEVKNAFCAVRPPGHHASYANSSGFCVFNNVAIGAKYALEKLGLERVAIVDFDVHHGDGTQNIVENDERIIFCSSFQHPFYPFSGDAPTRENILNVPIPASTSGAEYRKLVAHWFDALDAFKPQLIFISAGFDAHVEDEMSYLRLVEDDYAWLTQQIKMVADKHCQGHIVSVLEGGYSLSALGRSVVAHLKVLVT